jgi:hypothetical protein
MIGTMPITRSSTAAANQVAQPRFDPPETTKFLRGALSTLNENISKISIVRTTAFKFKKI